MLRYNTEILFPINGKVIFSCVIKYEHTGMFQDTSRIMPYSSDAWQSRVKRMGKCSCNELCSHTGSQTFDPRCREKEKRGGYLSLVLKWFSKVVCISLTVAPFLPLHTNVELNLLSMNTFYIILIAVLQAFLEQKQLYA